MLNDVARENGLGASLLERLLGLYIREYSDYKSLNYHRHSLLTNYRCHPSILMLASSLFYECTLLGRSASKVHPKAPFPLVFECSSLKQGSYKVSSADNRREAEILVRKALEFVKTWPQVRDKPRIAILAGSGRQVREHFPYTTSWGSRRVAYTVSFIIWVCRYSIPSYMGFLDTVYH